MSLSLDRKPRFEYITLFDEYNKHQDEELNTNTISRYLLSMDLLEMEYRFNETYKKYVNQIKKKYVGWKKVRGDGNCYYRSVMSSFILNIFNVRGRKQHLEDFYNKLKTLLSNDHYTEHHATVQRNIVLFEFAVRDWEDLDKRIENYKNINILLQDTSFDLDMVLISRIFALEGYKNMKADDELNVFLIGDDDEFIMRNLMELGREAEGIELFCLPLGLDIEVTQVNFLVNIEENIFPKKDETGSKIKVSIISKSRGHYDGLYSKKELEKNGYNLKERKYYYMIDQ